MSLVGLVSVLPSLVAASPSITIKPSDALINKWYPILAYGDFTIDALVSKETFGSNENSQQSTKIVYHVSPEDVYQCVNEMETFERKCKVYLYTDDPNFNRKVAKVARTGIPSIRRRFGKKDNVETDSLILFKDVNDKGILVNLENSKRDDLFISWNAWVFQEDITSLASMSYDTVFVDYIRDEQYEKS